MFQFLATGAGGVRNWAGFDRVIDRANQHGIKLIAVIGNYQSGTGGCDDGAPKTTDWYRGGYAQVATWQSQSYVDYAKSFVQRYRNEPTIAIIEYMNEPAVSGTCNQADAANAMRSFFDAMAKQVKALDPNHLFGSGTYGGDQCGVGTSYAKLHESPGIDVASFHDYSSGPTTLDATLSQRLKEVSKPLIVGESGIKASDSVTCGATRDVRAAQHKAKRSAQFSAGADAYIMWNAWPVPNDACVYENLNAVDPSVGW